MKLLQHQQKFASGYKDKALLVHEGGTGKTICACVWLKDGRDADALVICPRKIVKKWQKTLTEWGTKATVISKEDFKKAPQKKWSARVVDEADEFASPLFIAKKRSQLSTKLYEQVQMYPRTPTLLLTATPIRSNPWNLHSLLCYMGNYIDYKRWREHFFKLKSLPYIATMAYIPRENWRSLIRPILEKHADIVLLKDCVDLPPVEEETISTKVEKFVRTPESKVFFDEHRHEQGAKLDSILEVGKEYRKVLVVAYYREQIELLEQQLSKDKTTYSVHGGTKNQEDIITKAQNDDYCYLIVQASLGAGFDADTFSVVVFASMSYAVRDYVQMKFRVRRIHNLHPVKYVYLHGGRCDRAVFNNVQLGKDFIPSEWKE